MSLFSYSCRFVVGGSIPISVTKRAFGMVEATIEDLVFTNRSSRVTIWGHPHIVGEAVLSTTLQKD
jgi:hypothetical protein